MGSKLNVLYQSDDNYAVYLGVSLFSLLKNNREADEIDIYVIDDEISDENRKKLFRLTERYGRKLILKDASVLREKAADTGFESYLGFRKNRMSFLKMFVSEVVPETVERLIYIDCDTLVCGDLRPLAEQEMYGHPIAMVQDCLMGDCKEEIGIRRGEPYFNSGVILFDMKVWKEKKCLERIVDHARNVRVYGTVDQDFYNVVLKGDIRLLNPSYNLQGMYLAYSPRRFDRIFKQDKAYYTEEEIVAARKAPVIIHFLRFLGEYPLSATSIHPVGKRFDAYLRHSPWKDYEKKPGELAFSHQVERFLYRILPEGCFLRIFRLFHGRMLRKSERESRGLGSAVPDGGV